MRRRILKLPLKRRRLEKTDYRIRKRLISSGRPRAVVRRSLTGIYVQIIEYDPKGDRVICASSSHDLKPFNWKYKGDTTPAAYLVGYLAGKKALSKGISSCILDIGVYSPSRGARVFSVVKGLIDAGVEVPHSDEVLPDESRIYGEHISKEIRPEVMRIKDEIDKHEHGAEVKTDE